MNSVQITTPTCFSNFLDFDLPVSIIDDVSKYKFNGDNGAQLFRHTITLASLYDRHDVPLDVIARGLFSFTFKG